MHNECCLPHDAGSTMQVAAWKRSSAEAPSVRQKSVTSAPHSTALFKSFRLKANIRALPLVPRQSYQTYRAADEGTPQGESMISRLVGFLPRIFHCANCLPAITSTVVRALAFDPRETMGGLSPLASIIGLSLVPRPNVSFDEVCKVTPT